MDFQMVEIIGFIKSVDDQSLAFVARRGVDLQITITDWMGDCWKTEINVEYIKRKCERMGPAPEPGYHFDNWMHEVLTGPETIFHGDHIAGFFQYGKGQYFKLLLEGFVKLGAQEAIRETVSIGNHLVRVRNLLT
jgi:hypothetical protein